MGVEVSRSVAPTLMQISEDAAELKDPASYPIKVIAILFQCCLMDTLRQFVFSGDLKEC